MMCADECRAAASRRCSGRRRVGAGAHLPGYARDARCESSPSPIRRRSARRRRRAEFGIPRPRIPTTELIARDDIDLVDVCTPSDTHFELSWAALEAGKHVLCEKPVAYDYRDTRRAAALAQANGLKTKLGFTFRYSPAMRYMKRADRRRLRRHAVHLQRLRAELAVAGSADIRCGRWIHEADPVGDPGVIARGIRRADHGPRAPVHGQPTSAQVVGTMQNFIPERMVRATGTMMRMNIDDGDIFIGEFASGAIGSIQTSFVTVGNYPGHRGARVRQQGRADLPARRGERHLRVAQGRDAPTRSSSASSRCRRGSTRRAAAARVVALAVLREPRQLVHHARS